MSERESERWVLVGLDSSLFYAAEGGGEGGRVEKLWREIKLEGAFFKAGKRDREGMLKRPMWPHFCL